jgi:hypothetical protein
MKKEYIWELNGCSGSVFASNYNEARNKINEELSIQEVEEWD